jgi:predicted dehydrogenase
MTGRIGVGLVGMDHWYTALAVLRNVGQGAKLVAVADRSRKRLDQVAGRHAADYSTTDFDKVIADPNVHLVVSQVNTRDNVAVTRKALRAGKHVACVKPMAMNLRQADSLIELAEEQGCVLWSFDQLGSAAASPRLKSLLKGGAIGQPIAFYQTMWAGLPMPWEGQTGPSWWLDPELVPFGAWADHAIYTIAMLRSLFDAEVELVQAEMGNKRYPKLKLEDYGVATLRFTNGLVAVVEQTWTGGPYYPSWTKIEGNEGVIHMERAAFGDDPVLVTAKGAKPLKLAPRRRGSSLDTVLGLIREGKAKPSPARESRTNLAVALAAYKSAKTGRAVAP